VGRRRAEPIEVFRRDDVPEQFLWHDRLYLVREVLTYWREAGQWWKSLAAVTTGDALGASTTGSTGLAPPRAEGFTLILTPPREGRHASGEPAPDIPAAVDPLAVDDRVREFWRVEAVPERTTNSGIYDLCFDWSGGHWHLIRVED